jgi:hypothetical protein
MATTIGTIGGDLIVYPDYIYSATAMPNNTNSSSSVFQFGKSKSGVELKVSFDAETVIASSKTLSIDLLQDSAVGGNYATVTNLASYTAGTITAGTTLRFTPTEATLQYCKIKVTTTDNLSGKNITAYVHLTE